MSYVISVVIKYLGLIGERLQIFTVDKLNVGIFKAGIKSKSYESYTARMIFLVI